MTYELLPPVNISQVDKAETMIETSLCPGRNRADHAEDLSSLMTTMPLAALAVVVSANPARSKWS